MSIFCFLCSLGSRCFDSISPCTRCYGRSHCNAGARLAIDERGSLWLLPLYILRTLIVRLLPWRPETPAAYILTMSRLLSSYIVCERRLMCSFFFLFESIIRAANDGLECRLIKIRKYSWQIMHLQTSTTQNNKKKSHKDRSLQSSSHIHRTQ